MLAVVPLHLVSMVDSTNRPPVVNQDMVLRPLGTNPAPRRVLMDSLDTHREDLPLSSVHRNNSPNSLTRAHNVARLMDNSNNPTDIPRLVEQGTRHHRVVTKEENWGYLTSPATFSFPFESWRVLDFFSTFS